MSSKLPEWFWAVLDKARPSLRDLSRELEQFSKERLIEYARIYLEASHEVCDFWNGPTVDGIPFSEDSTEDLCDWVVAQGAAYWRQAVELNGRLEPVVRAYWRDRERPIDQRSWSTDVDSTYRGYQSPSLIARGVFWTRFGEELTDLL